MSTLLRPELERFLTRRVTWIGGLVGALLILGFGLLTSIPKPYTYAAPHGYRPPPLPGVSDGIGPVMVVAIISSALAYFMAASYAGSEQSNGALGTWLTFTPTRWPVYLTKVVTVTVPSFLFSLGFGVLLVVLRALFVPSRPGTLPELLGLALRVAVLAACLATLGLVVAVIGRSTLSALGVLVGYLALVVMRIFAASIYGVGLTPWFDAEESIGRFLLADHSAGDTFWVMAGTSYFDYPAIALSAVVWLAVMVVVIALGGLVFARRDVN